MWWHTLALFFHFSFEFLSIMTVSHASIQTPATYLIGVDTGGTYTDAAIIEERTHRVIASA
jgi:hypothetical protein